ncbi:Cellulose synthase operon protein C [Paraburkholderia tropica]|nr:Cellulose synthase operon protein C [Paraburkholderia tropica]
MPDRQPTQVCRLDTPVSALDDFNSGLAACSVRRRLSLGFGLVTLHQNAEGCDRHHESSSTEWGTSASDVYPPIEEDAASHPPTDEYRSANTPACRSSAPEHSPSTRGESVRATRHRARRSANEVPRICCTVARAGSLTFSTSKKK